MLSTEQMVVKLTWLLGTKDLTPWEENFIKNMRDKRQWGLMLTLTEGQLNKLQQLYDKYFA